MLNEATITYTKNNLIGRYSDPKLTYLEAFDKIIDNEIPMFAEARKEGFILRFLSSERRSNEELIFYVFPNVDSDFIVYMKDQDGRCFSQCLKRSHVKFIGVMNYSMNQPIECYKLTKVFDEVEIQGHGWHEEGVTEYVLPNGSGSIFFGGKDEIVYSDNSTINSVLSTNHSATFARMFLKMLVVNSEYITITEAFQYARNLSVHGNAFSKKSELFALIGHLTAYETRQYEYVIEMLLSPDCPAMIGYKDTDEFDYVSDLSGFLKDLDFETLLDKIERDIGKIEKLADEFDKLFNGPTLSSFKKKRFVFKRVREEAYCKRITYPLPDFSEVQAGAHLLLDSRSGERHYVDVDLDRWGNNS